MADYKSFFHVLRLEDTKMDVNAFLNGTINVFVKLDGTNAVIWSKDGEIHCGSRKREISLVKDNADFMLFATTDKSMENLRKFLIENPNLICYGEWLSGWSGRKQTGSIRKYLNPGFWIFAMFDIESGNYLCYDVYAKMLEGIYNKVLKPIAVLKSPKKDDLISLMDNHFNLPDDVKSEGIVLYNYNYRDKFNHPVIAKIVHDEYYNKKGNRPKSKNPVIREGLEQDIVDAFVTDSDCSKCQQKIMTMFDMEDWEINNKTMSAYLNMLFTDLVQEEMYSIIKRFRNPIIDFGVLKNNVFIKGRKYLGLM